MEKRESDNAIYDSKTLGELIRELRGSHSQNWMGKQLGVTSKHISLVEHDHRNLPPYRLGLLASKFHLDIDKLAKISKTNPDKISERYNADYLVQTDIDECITQIELDISLVRQSHEIGNPELAKSQLFFTIDSLEKRVNAEQDLAKDIRELKHYLIEAYNQRMVCNNDLQLRGEAVKAVLGDFGKLKNLAKEIGDEIGLAIGYTWLAGAYYVDGDFKKARENALRALPYLKYYSSYLAETLRGLMMDHAKSKNSDGYKLFERQAKDAIEEGLINTPMDVATIYEGIGQSKTHLGDLDAIFKFQDARKEMHKLNEHKKSRPLRYLQIKRSELNYYLTMKLLGFTIDYQTLGDLAESATNSAITLKDYVRHHQEINRLIRRLDIPPLYRPKTNNSQQSLFFR